MTFRGFCLLFSPVGIFVSTVRYISAEYEQVISIDLLTC
jgi:hypothetical protein